MTKIAFVDTETTGLDPDLHEIWEVAVVVVSDDDAGRRTWLDRQSWQLPVDLGRAESMALTVGNFHERRAQELWPTREFAAEFAAITRGAHLAGMVVSFDEERLRKLLRSNGACPEWHYHLIDVENIAAGHLKMRPPYKSEELSLALGVDPATYDRHTAMGDVEWSIAIYDTVMKATS